MNSTDKKLFEALKNIKQGNIEAFTIIFERFSLYLLKIAYRYLKNIHDAEDIVEDVFIGFIKNIKSIRENTSPLSYLYRAVINRSLNKLKKFNSNTIIEIDYHSLSPEEHYFKKKKIENVKNAIEELPPIFKEVVKLKIYDELSYKDIAKALNIKIGTVMSRLSRAKKRLKEKLNTDLNIY